MSYQTTLQFSPSNFMTLNVLRPSNFFFTLYSPDFWTERYPPTNFYQALQKLFCLWHCHVLFLPLQNNKEKVGYVRYPCKIFLKKKLFTFPTSSKTFFFWGEFSAKCFLTKNNLDNLSDRYSLGPCLIFLKEYKIFLGKWISMLTCGEK